jgi:phage shock protein PspC (stress-responsive transcriptional regulator)
MGKKLYKSRTDVKIDGVCAGIAKYFGIDATLVRLIWIIVTICGGAGILLYIIGMLIMPREPMDTDYNYQNQNYQDPRQN